MRRSALVIAAFTFVTPLVLFAAVQPDQTPASQTPAQTPAQTPPQTPPATQTAPQTQTQTAAGALAKTANPLDPVVEYVDNVTRTDKDDKARSTDVNATQNKASADPNAGRHADVELRDVLRLKVRNLDAWRGKDPKNAALTLHLFLAGIELKNVTTEPTAIDATDDPAAVSAVLVTLEPENDNDKDDVVRKAWVQVLQAAMRRDDKKDAADKRIPISIGPADAAPFVSNAKVALHVFPWYTPIVIIFLAAVAIGIGVLAKLTPLLRDANGAADPPYSLAKHQMAVWFVVVIGAYLYIWLITGFFSSISTTALTLIGISATTGLAAVAMDAGKRTDAATTRVKLEAERDALDKTINDPATGLMTQLKAAAPGSPTATELTTMVTPKLARLEELKTLLAVPLPPPQPNVRWYLDLLSDDSGISFHRLQMAVWTVVLAVVFVRAVYTDILMPDFDTTLLGLMGISSGTYIGFKFPEKPS